MTWVLFLKRLPMKDRLHRWGMIDSSTCCFCQEEENQCVAVFQCQFTSAVWRKVLMYLGEYNDPQNWMAEARWIASKGLRKGFKGKIRRLCVTVVVYHVWRA
ncbi:hypothetical protein LIER_33949 [Lithospermum erythrorhizon]|uniref:Reverse transcriptase zinc-binding domain-containing protein n=1 Tax=Lithospermum erythrorhizon TaxID=34254 RepID=A0AAV3S2X1_LITER